MIRLKNLLLEQAWPKWNSNIADNATAMYRAAAGNLNTDGYFAAVKPLYDQLKSNLESDGWTAVQLKDIEYQNWEKWQSSHPLLMKLVNQYEQQGEEGLYRFWQNNVIPNLKQGAWESADKSKTIHASTWGSFDEWVDNGTDGLILRACSVGAKSYKSCTTKPVVYTGGQLQF